VKAIELIALHAEKMMGFYIQEPSGQWMEHQFWVTRHSYVFGMAGVLQAPQEAPEFDICERKQLLGAQIEQGSKILEDPYQFLYSLKHNGLGDVRDRVKQMFNRSSKPDQNKAPPHVQNNSTDSIKKSYSNLAMNIEPINEENEEYLMNPKKLTVRKILKIFFFLNIFKSSDDDC
jgi:hypothetical protein